MNVSHHLPRLLIALLVLTSFGQAQEDIDPGFAPEFTPPAPTQTTVKAFPATPESPMVIPSHDGASLIVSVPTNANLDYQAQSSPDLKAWSDVHRRDASPGNDSIRTFAIEFATRMAFARIAVF